MLAVRESKNQRNVKLFLVEGVAVCEALMLVELFAMVREEDDHQILEFATFPQTLQQAVELLVHIGDLRVVQGAGCGPEGRQLCLREVPPGQIPGETRQVRGLDPARQTFPGVVGWHIGRVGIGHVQVQEEGARRVGAFIQPLEGMIDDAFGPLVDMRSGLFQQVFVRPESLVEAEQARHGADRDDASRLVAVGFQQFGEGPGLVDEDTVVVAHAMR